MWRSSRPERQSAGPLKVLLPLTRDFVPRHILVQEAGRPVNDALQCIEADHYRRLKQKLKRMEVRRASLLGIYQQRTFIVDAVVTDKAGPRTPSVA